MTHRNLKRLTEAALREEIKASRKLLEDRFGVEIKHFCYPYGAWNQAALDIVQQAGYSTACTVQFGVNKPNTPPFQLRRIVPLTGAELLAKLRHRLRR
jgi:peptidoglycan/xylan/chitin deacetylase (PgdA/CDA1 family)